MSKPKILEPANFQTTQWSVVLRAGEAESHDAFQALEQLCQAYWYPLYAYVRRQGLSPDEAQDVTQGFFAHLLDKSAIANVHPDKGRFRAFLLASIKNYLRNHHRGKKTQRRGGDARTISIQDEEFEKHYQQHLSTGSNAESQFDRDWVESLLKRVIDHLRSDYEAAGRIELFEVLHPFLSTASDRVPQAEIAEQFKMSISGVKMSVHRMRQQYAMRVRAEIAATVESPDEVEDELTKLIQLMRN